MACNRVSELLPFAHSGITAEGDNSVLCQKVTKEIMIMLGKGQFQSAKPSKSKGALQKEKSPTELETQIDLVRFRENLLIQELQGQTQTKVQNGGNIYEIWMRQDNELVQNLAKSFGERIVVEFALERISRQAKSQGVQKLLRLYLQLHLNSLILKDLGWYIMNELVSLEGAKALFENQKVLIDKIHPHALETVNSFGIPEHLITAPMA